MSSDCCSLDPSSSAVQFLSFDAAMVVWHPPVRAALTEDAVAELDRFRLETGTSPIEIFDAFALRRWRPTLRSLVLRSEEDACHQPLALLCLFVCLLHVSFPLSPLPVLGVCTRCVADGLGNRQQKARQTLSMGPPFNLRSALEKQKDVGLGCCGLRNVVTTQ